MQKRKKTGKILVSLFVCFSMVVTMIPSVGWADSSIKSEAVTGNSKPVTEQGESQVEKDTTVVEPNTSENKIEPERETTNKVETMSPVEQVNPQTLQDSQDKKEAEVDKPALFATKNGKKISMKTLGYKVNVKTTANLNVRKSPSASSAKVGYLNYDTKFVINGFVKNNNGTWFETTVKGKRGYVSADYVNVNNYTFKSRVGRTTATVPVYTISTTNTLVESFSIPKNRKVRIVSRISTNKGDRYKVKYDGKYGYIKNTGIDVDPIIDTFKMPMTLKFKLLDSANAYKGIVSNGKPLYKIAKNETVYISEKISKQSYNWYKVKHNNKTVYCKTRDVDIVKVKYNDRIGITKATISTYTEEGGKVVKNNTIPKGKRFELIGRIYTTEEKSIYKVAYNGIEGYILNKNVDLNPIMDTFKYDDKLEVELKASTKLYKGTTTSYTVLYTVPKGTDLKISEKIYRDKEAWYKTTYSGKTVYCKVKDVDIKSETINHGQRNTTGSFSLYKEVSNKSKCIKTVPAKKRIDLLGKVRTEGTVYLEIKYSGIVGYAIEKDVKDLFSEEFIVDSYDFGLSVDGETTASTSFYDEPSKEGKKVFNVKKRTEFTTLGVVEMNTGEWYKISYKDKTLYVPQKDSKIARLIYKKIVIAYNTGSLNLRAGLGTNTKVKCVIPAKAIIEVEERYQTTSGYWYKVKYNGYTGYVKGSYIKFKDVGIDVSKYNTDIDWHKVKSSGIDFVFIRLGYTGYGNGVQVEDPYFKQHIEGAIDAGLDVGVYFFTQAINTREAKKEVDFATKVLEPYKDDVSLPLVVDSEYIDGSRPGRADHLSKTARTQVLDAFCSRVEYRGYEPMIYMSKSWITGNLNYEDIKQYPIWVAQYNTHNTTPQPYAYWQYTSGGSVPGIRGRVDMNIKI